MRVLGDKVFVEKKKEEEAKETKTTSGIYIPATVQRQQPDRNAWAKVVFIGSEVKDVKEGEEVLFDIYTVSEVKIEDKTYLILGEKEIIAVR